MSAAEENNMIKKFVKKSKMTKTLSDDQYKKFKKMMESAFSYKNNEKEK